jgi:hypothetical protein
MSSATLFRLSGIVLIIAAILGIVSNVAITLIFPDTSPTVPPSAVMSAAWGPLWIMSFISGVLLLFGLAGLYLRQAQHAGVVGLLGFSLTFLGFLFAYVVAGFFIMSVLPYLAPRGSTVIEDSFSTVALFGLGGGALAFLGTILLGISIIRAGVFPRLVGVLVLIGGIFSPATILGLNLIVSLIGSLATILLMLGLAWTGSLLFSRSESIVVQSHPSPTGASSARS